MLDKAKSIDIARSYLKSLGISECDNCDAIRITQKEINQSSLFKEAGWLCRFQEIKSESRSDHREEWRDVLSRMVKGGMDSHTANTLIESMISDNSLCLSYVGVFVNDDGHAQMIKHAG